MNMKLYIRNLMVFILASLIITLVFSSSLQGANSVVSLSKNVYLTDKAVEKEVVLYNFLNEGVYFTLKLNTSPFKSELSTEKVFIPANEYKTVKYKIFPIEDSTGVLYTASLETSFANHRYVEYFTIEQAFNKKCDVSLDVSYEYLEGNNYSLKMLFKNPNNSQEAVTIKEIKGSSFSEEKEVVVLGKSDFSYETVVSVNDNLLNIKYSCNNVILNKEIEVKKPVKMSGYISLNWADNFIESVYFKILLVVLLIILVLSFATRYLRHVHRKIN